MTPRDRMALRQIMTARLRMASDDTLLRIAPDLGVSVPEDMEGYRDGPATGVPWLRANRQEGVERAYQQGEDRG